MRRYSITVLFLLMAGLCFSPPVHGGELHMAFQAAPKGEVALIYFDTQGTALGAYQLEFSYNPRVVQIIDVKAGSHTCFGKPFARIDNETGRVSLNAFQGSRMDEPTGFIGVARIQFVLEKSAARDNLFTKTKALFVTPQGVSIPVD